MSMRRVRVRVRLTLSFLNCGSALFSCSRPTAVGDSLYYPLLL